MSTKSKKAAVSLSAEEQEKKRLAEEAAEKARVERENLSNAQIAFGRQRRFEKLARRDPSIAEIYNRMQAAEAAITPLRVRINELEGLLNAELAKNAPKA
jgi:hypothetical protein